jgi:arsenate reductase
MSHARLFFATLTLMLPLPIFGQSPSVLGPLRPEIEAALAEWDRIPAERRSELEKVADFVRSKVDAEKRARLTFICTHNSRRSHLSQIWAQTAAAWYGVPGIETFSGGTEATACHPRTVRALRRAGFSVVNPTPGRDNPRYLVQFAEDASPLEAFSKVYDQGGNPEAGFVAVMTCAAADQSCPLVAGSALRVAIPYVDPKVADGTDREEAAYDERSRQIAREMLYLMSRVKD